MTTSKLLKILSSPSKAAIILKLLKCNDNPTVTQMCNEFDLKQSNLSKHLMDLKKIGIVVYDKNGKESNYYLDEKFLKEHEELVLAIANTSKCSTFKL